MPPRRQTLKAITLRIRSALDIALAYKMKEQLCIWKCDGVVCTEVCTEVLYGVCWLCLGALLCIAT